jgi:SAM-dependent methyltransferase
VSSDEFHALVSEETSSGGSSRGRWHAEYLSYSYRSAVERAMARVDGRPQTVLKTDLWNECLGGMRDIAGHFQEKHGYRFFGLDLEYRVCAQARSRVPAMHVVQADIRALPFRAGSFDAVLDLSTLDHLPDDGVAHAIDGYRQVLRDHGVLLLIFWQRNLLMKQRIFLKRLLGRREKPDQHYFARAAVRAKFGGGLVVVKEFVTGSLLIPPQPLTSFMLGRLPARWLTRFLRWLVDLEHSAILHPLLKHFAGLYGFAALRRKDAGHDRPDAA